MASAVRNFGSFANVDRERLDIFAGEDNETNHLEQTTRVAGFLQESPRPQRTSSAPELRGRVTPIVGDVVSDGESATSITSSEKARALSANKKFFNIDKKLVAKIAIIAACATLALLACAAIFTLGVFLAPHVVKIVPFLL